MVGAGAVFSLSILAVSVQGQSYTAFHLAHPAAQHDKEISPRHEIFRENIKNIRANVDDHGIQRGSFKNNEQSITYFNLAKSNSHPHLREIASRQGIFREDIKNPRASIGISEYENSKAGIKVFPEVQRGHFRRHPAFVQSGNVVEDTKEFVKSAKALFKFLSWSKEAQLTFNIVFETSECLKNVEDVIELMDETVKLIEQNAPEILYLEAIVENLKDVRDVNKQISESAKMLRALGHLIPALSNSSPRLCISSTEDSIRSFKSLAHALIDIRNHRDITLDDTVIHHLEFSSKVMSDTAAFLIKLQKSLRHFKKKCENNKRKDAAVYDTIADIMDSLADLFHALGFEDKVAAIKKQILFVKRITRPFEDLNELATLETWLTCDFEHGSYEQLAQTLDDIEDLIKNVGLQKISEDLGIDFELELIYEV